jgi:methylmalonyl-CoA/ethylmalonyl-CoA epimerase
VTPCFRYESFDFLHTKYFIKNELIDTGDVTEKNLQNIIGVCLDFFQKYLPESEAVQTAFLMIGESKIELLEASNPDSAIGKFLEKKGQGIHHIAFDVENIFSEIERLKNEGFELIHVSPKDGADNKIIAFLHPKSTEGVLVELCQEKS